MSYLTPAIRKIRSSEYQNLVHTRELVRGIQIVNEILECIWQLNMIDVNPDMSNTIDVYSGKYKSIFGLPCKYDGTESLEFISPGF